MLSDNQQQKVKHKEMTYKTFEELGISFKQSSSCYSCDGESCHNNVNHKNGVEYNVHVSTKDKQIFNIHATQNSNTSDASDIDEPNLTELEAVKYLCDNFNWFRCF